MVSNAYRCETLKGHTPYLDSSIREFHTISGLVSEKYSCPVFQRDNTPVGDVSECDFASTECELLVVWPHAGSMVTVSDCLQGNPCTSDILRVILQDTSRDKASSLDDNKTVFTLSCDPFATTTMTMPLSVSLKPFLHLFYSALGHHKDTCHMSFGKPSLKHPDPSIHLFGLMTPSYS